MSDDHTAVSLGEIDLSAWARRLRGEGDFETDRAEPEPSATGVEAGRHTHEHANGHAAANDALEGLTASIAFAEESPFYLASVEGRLARVNDAYRRLATRRSGRFLMPGAFEDGSEVSPRLKAVIDRILATGQGEKTEEWLDVDGRETCWRGRHFPVRGDGDAIVAVAGYYDDATGEIVSRREALRARQRFSDFARATSDWFWEADRNGRILLLSERFSASVGEPAAEYIGQPLWALAAETAETALADDVAKAVSERSAFRNLPLEIKAVDGSLRRCHLSGVPVFEPGEGTFLGFRGAGMDVTEAHREAQRAALMQRDLEETLEELTRKNLQLDIASAQAESALRAKNEFLAAMSHELRTPLNAIIGFAEAMQMEVFGSLNEQYRTYCQDINGAGRHLLSLINDVLDVAVLDADGVTLQPETLPLEKILDQAVSLVEMRAEERGLDLSAARIETDLDVIADDRRATQIFLNLLTNAVKFTPEGGAIGIEAETEDGLVHVTVWDTGIGIPADKLETVFEKFQQVTETVYSRKSEGTGLGLHISRQLARLMGGDISLSSTLGEGSRFTVTLPLA